MKKKLVSLILGSSVGLTAIFMAVLIAILMIFDFFGNNEISLGGYIENNMEYADDYIKALNTNIKNGYVNLSRLLYFYVEDDSLSFSEIYQKNLDSELLKMKPISDVCENSYTSFFVCSDDEIKNSNQLDVYPYTPFNLPVELNGIYLSSYFGHERIVYGKENIHYAWDLAGKAQTPIYSVGNGTVKTVRFNQNTNEIDVNNGAGNYIVIEYKLENYTVEVLYGHLYPNSSKVKVGDQVTHWQQIASMGQTGYSTADHLHFEGTLDDQKIDLMYLIDFTLTKPE